MMKELGVTLNAVAFLRESRKAKDPDPVMAAFLAEQAAVKGRNVSTWAITSWRALL